MFNLSAGNRRVLDQEYDEKELLSFEKQWISSCQQPYPKRDHLWKYHEMVMILNVCKMKVFWFNAD